MTSTTGRWCGHKWVFSPLAGAAWSHLARSCLRVGFCRIQSEAVGFLHFRFCFSRLGIAQNSLSRSWDWAWEFAFVTWPRTTLQKPPVWSDVVQQIWRRWFSGGKDMWEGCTTASDRFAQPAGTTRKYVPGHFVSWVEVLTWALSNIDVLGQGI